MDPSRFNLNSRDDNLVGRTVVIRYDRKRQEHDPNLAAYRLRLQKHFAVVGVVHFILFGLWLGVFHAADTLLASKIVAYFLRSHHPQVIVQRRLTRIACMVCGDIILLLLSIDYVKTLLESDRNGGHTNWPPFLLLGAMHVLTLFQWVDAIKLVWSLDAGASSVVDGTCECRLVPSTDEARCPICLDGYDDEPSVAILNCAHVFHSSCLNQWIQRVPTCPVCRTDVEKCSEQQSFQTPLDQIAWLLPYRFFCFFPIQRPEIHRLKCMKKPCNSIHPNCMVWFGKTALLSKDRCSFVYQV